MEKEENILINNIDGYILDLLDKDKEYIVKNRTINILIKAHEFSNIKSFIKEYGTFIILKCLTF